LESNEVLFESDMNRKIGAAYRICLPPLLLPYRRLLQR
jgi:hypothetical protein